MGTYSANSDVGNKAVVEGTAFDFADMQFNNSGKRCIPSRVLQFRVTSLGYFAGENPLFFQFPVFIIQIFSLIFVNRLVYYLLRPLKQPRIVSDVIGGLLLGPNVLGHIHVNITNIVGITKRVSLTDLLFPDRDFVIIHSISALGAMFYLFLIGVKIDPHLILQSGKKHWVIGLASFILPFFSFGLAFFGLEEHLDANIARGRFLIFTVASVSVTSFPVLADILTELHLLNSELGRLAISSAMVHGCFGFFFMSVFIAINQGQGGWEKAMFSLLSLAALMFIILFVCRPWMQWIVRRTRKGRRIEEKHMFYIFISVIVMGTASDFVGASFLFGPFVMGLAVPDGPPLGAALVEKAHLLVGEALMPLFFGVCGLDSDFRTFNKLRRWLLVVVVVLMGYVAKVVGTMVAAIYCKISFQNAFMLGLMMNFRGMVDILTFAHFKAGALFSHEMFTLFTLVTVLGTAIAVPLVSTLYKPLASGYILGRRAIQHLKPHAELRILACLQSEDPISSIINLLDVSSPSQDTPLCVYVLHLKKLVGRAASTLIAHKNAKGFVDASSQMDPIHNVFLRYEHSKSGHVAVQPFTSIAPSKTMHQDICWLAAEKNVALVIVPFQKKHRSTVMDVDREMRSNIPSIQAQAPCSIGILVYPNHIFALTTQTSSQLLQHHIAILFWGGRDDREALTYASRMVRRPGVSLIVYHFSLHVDRRDIKERKLDDHLLASVQFENTYNDRFKVEDIVVRDEEQTIKTARSIGDGYNLLIVGRRQGANSLLLEDGLAEWAEFPELGVVGDMLASNDFEGSTSVLVVQNQA